MRYRNLKKKEAQIADIEYIHHSTLHTHHHLVSDGCTLYLCYLSFLFGGSFGRAVGRDNIHRNATWRRRIHRVSNPTSAMNKPKNYISSMVVKTSVASISKGKYVIHIKLKKKKKELTTKTDQVVPLNMHLICCTFSKDTYLIIFDDN